MRPSWFVFALVALAACRQGSCATKASAKAGPPKCFEMTAEDNSATTNAIFGANHCQGGGVTWAALAESFVLRKGASEAAEADQEEGSEWTGDLRVLHAADGPMHYAIDDEADDALFCTDSDALLADVKASVAHANADGAELLRAMHESNRLVLECEKLDAPVPAPPASR